MVQIHSPLFLVFRTNRKKSVSIFSPTAKKKIKILTGEKANKFLKKNNLKWISRETSQKTKQLKGQIASIGKVSGRVRILLEKKDIPKLKTGEIIVASMTNPNYIPAMKKAAAIITNEGGVTCHAAIVSRELGIPCIIGTKIATQVLRDGDRVEVDAEKGVIKVLTK